MKKFAEIKHDLEFYPEYRERKNRNKYIAFTLEKKYKTGMSPSRLMEMLTESETMQRGWRNITQNNPRLRGTDYDEKVVLEQQVKLSMGYEPELKTLSDSFKRAISDERE